jgi:adenosylcobinamide-GDP ribazoletransferase
MNAIDRFFTTVASVTCLPFGSPHADSMRGLAKYLPAVGLLIGALLLAAQVTLGQLAVLPAVASILLTVLWLILSGGIHFDGLMDTADGIFSHRSPERMLEIMRDSRVGNFGVMTGFVILLMKVAGLLSLGNALPALLLIPCWSRWCESFAIGAFPYARSEGMGKIWHDSMQFPRDLALGAALPLIATAFCALQFGMVPTIAIALCTIASGIVASFYLSSILRGHTGDTYGAVVELAETGGLIFLTLLRSHL